MEKFNLRPEVVFVNICALALPLFLMYVTLEKISNNFLVLKDISFLAFCLVVIVLCIIYIGMPISYLREDVGKFVEINKEKKSVIITKDGNVKQFQTKEIIKCYYVKNSENVFLRSIFYSHRYLVLILNDYNKIFITNLIANPDHLVAMLGLKVDIIETYLPYVDKRIGSAYYDKGEYDKKVNEFYLIFADKTNDELKSICKRSSIYSKYAIIAAKQILKERANHNAS